MLRNILFVLIFTLFTGCAINQNYLSSKDELKKIELDENLLSHLRYILYLIAKGDLNTLNKTYINAQFGFYEISVDTNGNNVVTNRQYLEDIDNYVGSFDIKNEETVFSCSPYNDAFYGWDKDGVFISNNISNYLIGSLNEQNSDKKEFIKKISTNSLEVTVTSNLIFYITKINKNFYITLVDKVKNDCSNLNI